MICVLCALQFVRCPAFWTEKNAVPKTRTEQTRKEKCSNEMFKHCLYNKKKCTFGNIETGPQSSL